MSFYPATVISLDEQHAVVRIDATGHEISFGHDEPNALAPTLREVGTKGVISFPKAPPHFGTEAA
jgi:hypothetical protein